MSSATRQEEPLDDLVAAALAVLDRHERQRLEIGDVAEAAGLPLAAVRGRIGGRRQLTAAILEHALATADMPAPTGDWRADMTAYAYALRRTFSPHPGLARHALKEEVVPPRGRYHQAQLVSIVQAAGVGVEHAARLVVVFSSWVLRFLAGDDDRPRPSRIESEALWLVPPPDAPTTFATGVAWLLDAIGREIDAARAPAAPA